MLVSRFYGLGVLTAIAHKAFLEYLIATEENFERRNPIGMIAGIVGAVLNQPEIPPVGKWADIYLPYLSCAIAFSNPSTSLFIGVSHLLCKYLIIHI
jgi:hypothetical protein